MPKTTTLETTTPEQGEANALLTMPEHEKADAIALLSDLNLDATRLFRRCLAICQVADAALLAAVAKLSRETDIALKVATGVSDESDPIIFN
jgi:hypothetical protein